MNLRFQPALLAIALALPLAACNRAEPPEASTAPTASADPQAPRTALGRTVDKAMQEARRELATENISINDGINIGDRHGDRPSTNLPKAEITPAGDLLVASAPVQIDARQRALLLKYRGHVIAIAEAGMDLGVRGADLGMQAAADAIGSIFSGDTDGVEKRVEAEAANLEASALKLCAQLAPMLATQRELAAILPAFAPYATMTQEDVDKCMRDRDGNATRAEVLESVRGEVRAAVQASVDGAREAADAAKPAGDTQTPAAAPSR